MTTASADRPDLNTTEPVRGRGAGLGDRRSRGPLEAMGRRIVHGALAGVRLGGIRLVDGAGEVVCATSNGDDSWPIVDVQVLDPSFYSAAAFGGSVGIAEAYMDGVWRCDDLAALIEIITVNAAAMERLEGPIARVLSPLSKAAYWLERNTRAGSRRNIRAHYDLGNEFFALFLDPTMTYSCAIFEQAATTLEEAQIEKIDRACRKLSLKGKDHLLEIGTGWGALAIHAAQKYGCRVTTTTISEEQHRLATARVREAGVRDRVTVLQRDYRDLPGEFPQAFDKLVSIEMIEAVGREHLGTYFEVCASCLKPAGAALIQAIVIRDQFFELAAARRDFLKKYIFPGSCLPSVAAMLESVRDRTDLRVWHMEDIGPHYATTLRRWRDAFMSKLDDVRRMGFDERFIRMWEYYLTYCEGVFRARQVGDVQLLLTKPMCRIAPTGLSVVYA